MSTYKPTEHGGLKEDGTPDKRVGTGGGHPQFAHGKVDPHEAGKQGGSVSGTGSDSASGSDSTGGDYKPTEHGGMRKDGQPDGRTK